MKERIESSNLVLRVDSSVFLIDIDLVIFLMSPKVKTLKSSEVFL